MKIIVLLIMLLICSVGISSATDYYVSTVGNNSLNGMSIDTAWLTISHSVNSLTAGDTLYIIDDGIYESHFSTFQASGNSTHKIIVTAYNGTPLLNSSSTGTAFNLNGKSYITISDIKMNYYNIGITVDGTDGVIGLLVENVNISNTQSSAVQFSNFVQHSKIMNSTFINIGIGDVNGIGIYGTYGNYSNPDKNTHNITIQNNTINGASTAHSALDLFGEVTNIFIEGNDISGRQLFSHKTPNGAYGWMYGIYVMNNTVHNVAGTGIKLNADYSTVYGNNVHNNTINGIGTTEGNHNITYENNYVVDNTMSGADVTGHDMLFINNYIAGHGSHDHDIISRTGSAIIRNHQSANGGKSRFSTSGSTIVIEDTTNKIFTLSLGGTPYYPKYYPNIVNFTLGSGLNRYFDFNRDTTLVPQFQYLKDITVNTPTGNDLFDIEIDSSVAENPTTITFTVENETGNYSAMIDDVHNKYIDASNYKVIFEYSETGNEWDTKHDISLEYVGDSEYIPSITSSSPSTPTDSYVNDSKTFNAGSNQDGNWTWYIDSVLMKNTETDTANATYTNSTALNGTTYNVTTIITNVNGSAQTSWNWTVLQNDTIETFIIPVAVFVTAIFVTSVTISKRVRRGFGGFINRRLRRK